jgi:DNA relaxase NicK
MLSVNTQINQSNYTQNLGTAPTNSRVDSQKGRKIEESVSCGYTSERSPDLPKSKLSIDWLTFTAEFDSYDQFIDKTKFFLDYLDDDLIWGTTFTGKIGRCFSSIWRSIRGGKVGINALENGRIDCIFVLTGAVLAGADHHKLMLALKHLYPWFTSCTRMDIAYDNNSGILGEIRPKMRECWQNGLQAGFKKMPRAYSGDDPDNDLVTYYLGTRGGNRLVRIYDKSEFQTQRFEVQVSRGRSHEIFKELINYLDQGNEYLEALTNCFSLAIKGIEFYDTVKKVNLDRNSVCSWWSEFKELIQYKNLELPKINIVKSIEKSIAWLRKSVAPTIAVITEFYGIHFADFLEDIRKEGKKRMNQIHKRELQRIKREGYQFIQEWNKSEVMAYS